MGSDPQTIQDKVTVRFSVPEHGWLLVSISAENFELQLDVSDVPANPLEELCSALTLVLQGTSAAVSWHLEPDWYYFQFEFSNELFALVIYEQPYKESKRKEVIRLTGSVTSIVLPFYRALKSLVIPSEEAWPTIEQAKLNKLTMLIKNARK